MSGGTGHTYAMDKLLSTRAVATADTAGDIWMLMEFDTSYSVHSITIHQLFYTAWFDSNACVKSEESYKECQDSQDNVEISIYENGVSKKSCDKLILDDGLEQEDQIYSVVCLEVGDSVKLTKDTGEGYIRIYEIVITSTSKHVHSNIV